MSSTTASLGGALVFNGNPEFFVRKASAGSRQYRQDNVENGRHSHRHGEAVTWTWRGSCSSFRELRAGGRETAKLGLVPGRGRMESGVLDSRIFLGGENFCGVVPSAERCVFRCGRASVSNSNSSTSSNDDNKPEWRSNVSGSAGGRRSEIKRIAHRRLFQLSAQKQGSGEQWGIKSRKVRIGLTYRLLQFGRAGGAGGGGASGGGNNGNGWGGSGGGGNGDEEDPLPSPDEGGFNFFTSLYLLLRGKCQAGLWVWAASAFLAGFFVSSLDLKDSAHARSFSKPRMLADGTNGGNGGGEKNGERAVAVDGSGDEKNKGLSGAVWEVKGGKWKRFITDLEEDEFLFDGVKRSEEEAQAYEHSFETPEERRDHKEDVKRKRKLSSPLQGRSIEAFLKDAGVQCGELVKQVFLPAGFPGSVTEDYLEFTYWRLAQIVASQISGVLTTQALLYAVGLGKGAIPTAAAVNWVLRDGIGYLSKIMLSKYGRHFDVHPKGWRLISDIIENASYGLELLTPAVPHLFVYLAAAAGAGRSAAGLIQAATKSCFNANFAAQRNFAEIIAKGEAQGMASKSVGIGLGILISGYVGSSGPLLVVTFGAVSALHIFFNLKSYQAVQLRTLNPYRASLVIAQYLESGNVPTIRDVNAEEPIFFGLPLFDSKQNVNQKLLNSLSPAAKKVASTIEKDVELGASLGQVVNTKGEADALMDLYSQDQYLLARRGDRMMVVLKDAASPRDMLRAMVQLMYIYNSDKDQNMSAGIIRDCSRDGILRVTYNLMDKNFDSITGVLAEGGWVSDGLVARPAPNRLVEDNCQTLQHLVDVKA
ncbi:hypothetical protein Mapa_000684 [Marchantia paleacea]|nr:hypothetical protein Mapa_000684 [Marchantia paleacea]